MIPITHPPLPSTTTESEPPLISVVCPAFNEAKALPFFHQALEKILAEEASRTRWEILYVDDGSRDGTWEVIRSFRSEVAMVVGIRLAANRGQQNAITAGLDHAQGLAVVTLDTDLQHPPALIPELVAHWRKGSPVVQTLRLEDPNLGWFKRITSRWFAKILAILTGLDVRPGAADFRLLDRQCLEKLQKLEDHPRMMRAAVASLKLPTAFITYKPASRVAGESKYGFTQMTKLAMQGFWTYGRWQKWLMATGFAWTLIAIALSTAFSMTADLATGLTVLASTTSGTPLALRAWGSRKRGEARRAAPNLDRYQISQMVRTEPVPNAIPAAA